MFRSFRAVFCALLVAIMLTLAAAGSAGAQGNLDCRDFDSRAEAQASLDADPSDPNGLDRNDDGQACENFVYTDGSSSAPAPVADPPGDAVSAVENDPDGDGSGDLDCADFASQEAAQAEYDADPSDPNGLDRDDDGYACEVFFGYIGNPIAGQPDVDSGTGDVSGSGAVTNLPDTGVGTAAPSVSDGMIAVLAGVFSLLALASALMVSRRRSI